MTDAHPDDDRLVALALEDLPASERDEIEHHLGTCEPCRRAVTSLRHALDVYRAAPDPVPPASGLARLLEAQSLARFRARRRVRARPGLALAAAALLLAFAGGFWAGHRSVTEAERGAPPRLASPLPEPPAVVFHAAVATD